MPQATWRERRGPPRVGQFIPQIAKAANKKFGFTEPHILNYWPEIVGPDLAKSTSPAKLSRDSRQGHGGTLTVRVSGPLGLELQHMEPQIIDRINRYYGFLAVSHLRLVRGPQTARTANRRRKQQPRPLSQDAQKHLAESLSDIEDNKLREALKTMGEKVLRRHSPR